MARTDAVIQQTSSGTHNAKVDYELTVTNNQSANNVQIEGSMDIPECNAGSTQGLVIYPNPGTNTITLNFDGFEEEEFEIYILDYQFNRVGKETYVQGQPLDISTLENGLYYLYTITKNGKVVTEKFCVGGH